MTRVSVNFDGMESFKAAVTAAAHDGLEAAAIRLGREMEDELNKVSTPIGEITGGKLQRGGGIKGGSFSTDLTGRGRRLYRGSPPGSAPGKRTGRLGDSINYTSPKDLTTRVGTAVEYGRHLEFGFTVRNNRKTPKQRRYVAALAARYKELGIPFRHSGPSFDVAARPWAKPALSKAKKAMQKDFDRVVRRSLIAHAQQSGGAE